MDTCGVLFLARRWTLSLAMVTSAGSLRLLVALLSGEAAWAVDDRMAVTADMWELAGGGRTSSS